MQSFCLFIIVVVVVIIIIMIFILNFCSCLVITAEQFCFQVQLRFLEVYPLKLLDLGYIWQQELMIFCFKQSIFLQASLMCHGPYKKIQWQM